jgi:3-oxoacyl-[acyl-carrier protein] reductase
MPDEQKSRVAFISGASRGIGRAVALQLAKDGYDIAFCYGSNEVAAKETEELIAEAGRRFYSSKCDVGDYPSVRAMFETIEQEFGPVSVVVNNAGINADAALPMMKAEDWTRVINTNLDSVFNVCRSAVFGLIRQSKGVIINISSVSGVWGNAGQTNYSAAKAGIIGFSKALSKEVGRYGIRVNVVAPGLIETDMIGSLGEKEKKEIQKRILLKRIGRVEDVSNLVSFLCSDRADYITGQVVQVDGGILV